VHTVVETGVYLREAGKLMSEAEREEVVTMIARDPEAGDVIAGTGGGSARFAARASGWWKERWFPHHLLLLRRDNARVSDADLREER
jgi:hypothetical protein